MSWATRAGSRGRRAARTACATPKLGPSPRSRGRSRLRRPVPGLRRVPGSRRAPGPRQAPG
ncbi:hypothetical protein F6X53_25550 [Methylobacterium soli]|uniref:Uncharacterized protein n=1 Tax=Methylobacterium soli TaxID=553447 RepID=A0A6L3SU41_9HYPH|nr:hypothetical protein F6X53_25550 [Methylobacterium soli]